jgi:hypothetical protein
VSHGAAAFFGVPPPKPPPTPAPEPGTPGSAFVSEEEVKRDAKWTARRLRHVNRRYGRVKDVPIEQRVATSDGKRWKIFLEFFDLHSFVNFSAELIDSVLAQLPSPSRETSTLGYTTAPPPLSAASTRFQPPSFPR